MTFDVENLRVRIVHDENAESPRTAYDNVARFAFSHRRYDLGDNAKTLGFALDMHRFDGWKEVESWLQAEVNPMVLVRVYGYDHGNLSLSTNPGGFMGEWDSGTVGFAYVTRENMEALWGKADVAAMTDEKRLERARKCIEGELECYEQYLAGDVWGYIVEEKKGCDHCGHSEWEELESCWGFYGGKDAEAEGRNCAEAIVDRRRAKQEQLEDAKRGDRV